MRSYIINGDDQVYNHETEEEAKANYIELLAEGGMDGEDLPKAEDLDVEELRHCYAIDGNCYGCGVRVADLLRKSDEVLPAGFHDSTWDDDHRFIREEFRINGRTFRLEADVIGWTPDLAYDPDGEYGSFELGEVTVTRVR